MAKFIELVLTALQYQAKGLLEMGDILFATQEETRRYIHRIPTYERQWFKTNWAETYRDRQQFYRTLNHLKSQGLVVKIKAERGQQWSLTKFGREKIQKYRKFRSNPFSSTSVRFKQPTGEGLTIVVFDIPEKERKKREWIRMCLVAMEFKNLQKSVWITKGKVHEDFFHALRERKMLKYVHIFVATKEGTLAV